MGQRHFFSICLLIIGANAVIRKEYSIIDTLRQNLFKLGDELNDEYFKRDNTVYNLINVYRYFGDNIEKTFDHSPDEYVDALNTIWIWARTQTNMRRINGFYMRFREMQNEFKEKNGFVSENEWINFAKNILHDPNVAVPQALKEITDNIVRQNLFVSAYKVLKKKK